MGVNCTNAMPVADNFWEVIELMPLYYGANIQS